MAPSGSTTQGARAPESGPMYLSGLKSRLMSQHFDLGCFFFFGGGQEAFNVPVKRLQCSLLGAPAKPSQCVDTLQGLDSLREGWRSNKDLKDHKYSCQRLNIRQSSWKLPRKSTGKQNSIDKKNLLNDYSFPDNPAYPRPRVSATVPEQLRKWPLGFLRPKRVGLTYPCASEHAMETSTNKHF